jgi:hypothetical protein
MSITTYTELKAAIADFLLRSDLTAVIPTFISLAEADMNRKMRHWRMEGRSTAQLDTQYSVMPADFLEAIRYKIIGTRPTSIELTSNPSYRIAERSITTLRPAFILRNYRQPD